MTKRSAECPDLLDEVNKLKKRVLKLERETIIKQSGYSDTLNMCIGPSTRGEVWTG